MTTYTIEELRNRNIVVFDLEIKTPINECSKGWSSYDEMGISVGCAFDYREMRYRVFMDDNIKHLVERLNEPNTLIVAFNNINFDNRLLRVPPLSLLPDDSLNNYDMLAVSRKGICAKKEEWESVKGPSSFGAAVRVGLKLEDHLKARNLLLKTGNGSLAPLLYKAGKLGELIDYCLNDVTVEKALFEDMWGNGVTGCAYLPVPYAIDRPVLT